MGRPSKLTPEVQEKVLQAIDSGAPLEACAEAAGICPRTLHAWTRRGKSEPDSEYGAFLHAVKKALADLMVRLLERLKEGKPGWQASAWLLERKWPQHWSADREILGELKRFLKERKRDAPGPTARPPGR